MVETPRLLDMRAIANLQITRADDDRHGNPRGAPRPRPMRLRVPRSRTEAFVAELLGVAEINADDRLVAAISFDLDDIDAAFEELDRLYLAGEAADHAHTWSVISGSYAAFNRHELPRTTPDWVAIDHRRGTPYRIATNLAESIRAIWDLTPDFSIHIEAVHRLSSFGAVYTHIAVRDLARRLRRRVAKRPTHDSRRRPHQPLRSLRRGRSRRRPLPL